MSSKKAQTPSKLQGHTIGLLISFISEYTEQEIWRAARSAGSAHDINVICFTGGHINDPREFLAQRNRLHDIIDSSRLDGLVVFTGSVCTHLDDEDTIQFIDRFHPLPLASISKVIPGVPSIMIDNYAAQRAVVTHLIETHNYERIAYIKGTKGHPEAEIRYQAYVDTLKEHNIPFDPKLVAQGDFYPESGYQAIEFLLEEQKAAFDAIVSANDHMVMGAVEALRVRGIRAPQDIALTGFDNRPEATYMDPPLTTVPQPWYEVGRRAFEIVLAQIQGEEVAEETLITPNIIERRSCGCWSSAIVGVESDEPVSINLSAETASEIQSVATTVKKKRRSLLTKLYKQTQHPDFAFTRQQIRQIFDALLAELSNSNPEAFLQAMIEIGHQFSAQDGDIQAIQEIVSALRLLILPLIATADELLLVENIFQKARVFIGEEAQRRQAYQREQAMLTASVLRQFGQEAISTAHTEDLVSIVVQALPSLWIESCYISLYTDPTKTTEMARLLLAYDEHNQVAIDDQEPFFFEPRHLIPDRFLDPKRRYALIVEPLYFHERQLGFALLEGKSQIVDTANEFGIQFSSALANVLFIEREERRAIQMRTAAQVSRAASSILDPEELIPNTVNLVQERFDLYYAGLFLVDEDHKWANLRAGTGEPGEKMLAENWQLEVGGSSMIGRCVATGQADIQLDVDQAPVHLRNPHLPKTKSEMALPLISRGQILGALTIQSERAHAFSEDDVTVLQSMADQLANAIDNAYLYNALAREEYLISALMENLPEAIYFKDRDSRFLRVSRFLVENFGVDDPGDVIGKTDFDFFTEEHARPAFEDEQQIIETGEALLNMEERETWEDRPDTWVLTSKLPLLDEQGNIVGTFGISRNITELKQIQIELERQSNQLQTTIDVSRAISEILEPDQLMQQVVDLIEERFGLYYTGLFLVDESGEHAILHAGSGEAGEKMLAENWQLAIDDQSMIGRCIESGQPDIQLDVDKAPTHLRNPHLPETKSEMALPLFSRGRVIGALTIQSTEPDAFSSKDAQVLQTMANQVATALSNARLFEQTQTALLDSETLLNISRLVSNTIEIDKSLAQVLDLTLKATGIEAGLLSIATPPDDRLQIAVEQLPPKMVNSLKENGLDGTLCDLVYRQQEPIVVHNLRHTSSIDVKGLIEFGFKSYQGVPIEAKGKAYGTLCTFNQSILSTEDTRINLLQAIGQQIGVAIENAQLFEQTQAALDEMEQQATQLTALTQLSNQLSQTSNVDEIFETGANIIRQILPSDRMSIARLTGDGHQIELFAVVDDKGLVPTGTKLPLESGLAGKAITTQESIIVSDATQNEYVRVSKFTQQDLKSHLVVPLIASGRGIGALNFGRSSFNAFSERDRDLALQAALLMGNTIENQSLLQQTRETLAELEAIQRRYQIQAWSSYNQSRVSGGFQQTAEGMSPIGKRVKPEVKRATQRQVPIVSEDGENLALTVPIMLRDQPIGAVGIQAKEGKLQWTPEEIALAQDISEQFALAAESLRLLDETQRRAARERLVAEITTKLRATNDPEMMLQTAAQELRAVLKAKRAQVLLQRSSKNEVSPEQSPPTETKRGAQ